jgi:CRP/FNR family transcriptional regulator, cyclic AMP receptor protein
MGSPHVSEPFVDCLVEQLESEGFICSLPPRAILFMEGDVPRGIHIISKGHVKLTISSREGRVLIINIADPGEILGLHNCITGAAYEFTAQTLQSCRVSFVKREALMWLLRNNHAACLSATQRLSRTCHAVLRQVGSIHFSHSANEKLARFLLTISADSTSAESSCPEEEGKEPMRVEMDLTHDEIAQAIGASRETVTRTLANFRKKQLANLTRSMLFVKNRAELEKIAGVAPGGGETAVAPSVPRKA